MKHNIKVSRVWQWFSGRANERNRSYWWDLPNFTVEFSAKISLYVMKIPWLLTSTKFSWDDSCFIWFKWTNVSETDTMSTGNQILLWRQSWSLKLRFTWTTWYGCQMNNILLKTFNCKSVMTTGNSKCPITKSEYRKLKLKCSEVQTEQHSRMFLWGPSDAERNSCGLPCLVSSLHGQNVPWRLNSCGHKHSQGTPPRTSHPAGTREQSARISTPKQLSTWSMSDTPRNCVTIKVPGYLQANISPQILK